MKKFIEHIIWFIVAFIISVIAIALIFQMLRVDEFNGIIVSTSIICSTIIVSARWIVKQIK